MTATSGTLSSCLSKKLNMFLEKSSFLQSHKEVAVTHATNYCQSISFYKRCCPKKIAEKEEGDIGSYRREGGKKNLLFSIHQNGDLFLWREGSKSFCCMSHTHFCVSFSTQFVTFLEGLH